MVLLFGLAVGPLGAVSVLLVILQPVLFDAWCTLCIATAAISVGLISPSLDEALASLQYLKREKSRGRLWPAFWGKGAADPTSPEDAGRHSPDPTNPDDAWRHSPGPTNPDDAWRHS
jgi:hypothetical protein